jgi:hypothetical protein
MRGWSAALILTLAAVAAPPAAGAQELRVAVAGAGTRVSATTGRGYPAYPITVLGSLGGELTRARGFVVVRLFGDTLRFHEGLAHFQVNETLVPLRHWIFAVRGVLYLPQTFYTEWLPLRYPERVRFADGTLAVLAAPSAPPASPPDTATILLAQRVGVPDPADGVQSTSPTRSGSAPPTLRRANDSSGVTPPQKPRTRKKKRPRDPDDLLPGTLQGFIDSRVSGVYDSNIDHDLLPQSSYGTVGRLDAGLQSARADPLLMAQYSLGVYRFAGSERWNRTTHDLGAEIAPAFGRVRVGLSGSVRVGSVTEDRELVNQLSLGPWLQVSLSPALRVGGYGEHRNRRVTGSTERSDTAWLAGLRLTRRWQYGGRWEVQGEYETNHSESASSRYTGWAGRAMFRVPLGKADRVGVELTHRRRHYPDRMVELESEEAPREDRRWTPALIYTHEFGEGYWTVELEYELESNRSNDPEEAYDAHRTGFTFRRRW